MFCTKNPEFLLSWFGWSGQVDRRWAANFICQMFLTQLFLLLLFHYSFFLTDRDDRFRRLHTVLSPAMLKDGDYPIENVFCKSRALKYKHLMSTDDVTQPLSSKSEVKVMVASRYQPVTLRRLSKLGEGSQMVTSEWCLLFVLPERWSMTSRETTEKLTALRCVITVFFLKFDNCF